ncbi:MAG: TonB-dependent receptor [Acidobacteria bacterium]|nr:MAG: TonB-dependent receptor [Acidobacteriota bacterium]
MAKFRVTALFVAAAIVAGVWPAEAQAPTGNISGRVVSNDGQPLPGVTVVVASMSTPGSRTAVTSANGDYLVALLPPGTYTISFEIEGFQTLRRTQNVAGTQNAMLDATMSPAAVSVSVDVVGQAQPFVETAQVATNFKQNLMATLPSNRTVDAVLLMAPAVHPTGPRGAYTINGSQSYENLYLLNGAVINENLRGLPMTPYIEDAIQEVTVASAGVSAEYGRFAGGVATAVTKSGGNSFAGSFRTTFANDSWRSFTPFESTELILNAQRKPSDLKLDKTVPTYEATVGGPLQREQLWFFGAMRSQVQKSQRTTTATNIPYTFVNDEQRYEGKLTYTPRSGHSVQGSYFKLTQILDNNAQFNVGDLQSLTRQGQPQSLAAVQYTGVLTPNFSLSAQYSERRLTFTEVGSSQTDRINGTLMFDLSRNLRYWSPTFCSGSACRDGDEERNNQNIVVKGSYFLSNNASGAHHVVFGYDYFNDNIIANTHASGSEYRIRGTSSVFRPDGTIYPVLTPNLNTTLDWNPLVGLSEGSNLRVHSLFVNDNWRWNERVTLNVGVRLDKNAATDGDHQNVGDDVSFSPRLAAIWDPRGDGKWAVSGSFARYTMALTSNLAGSTAKGGNAATYRWIYTGPSINPAGTPAESLVPTAEAIRRVFEWHDSLGGNTRRPAGANIPGVNMKLLEPLSSPYSMEYSGGVSRTLGGRGTMRADVIYRDFRNFYGLRTDLETGRVTDELTGTFDLNVVENTDRTERQYVGLTTQASYDFGAQLSVGGNYTLSRAWGDVEGEGVNTGPSGGMTNNYPEYRVASWNYPVGDLNIDQRHRARMWATYNVPMAEGAGAMTFGVLQQFASGVPYAAVGFVNPSPFLANPGYQTPPAALEYYFLGRNPFRTEGTYRTDLAVNYGHRLGRLQDVRPELFFHGELLNVFNQYQLCACGENVFRNGGISDLTTISQGTRILAPFNPYTTQPIENTHWQKAPTFGQAASRFAFTSPRTFRFSVGVRF